MSVANTTQASFQVAEQQEELNAHTAVSHNESVAHPGVVLDSKQDEHGCVCAVAERNTTDNMA